MTLALRLVEKGYKVTIFESSPKLGGLTGAVEMDGAIWDRFYHVILLSDLNTIKILNILGLEDKMNWVETKTGFYSEGKLYSMSNIFEFMKFPPINLVDKFRLGLTIVVASRIRNWKKMEGLLVERWLKRWSGKRVFEKIWLPLLRAKLGDHYKITSASFIWATIQRMFAARRTGLKKELFGYITGGYEVINRAFEAKLKELGVNIIVNSSVEKVIENFHGQLVVRTLLSEEYLFDKVISTLPSDISAEIATGLDADEIERHRAILYLGVVCPSILLKKPLSKFYVTNIIDTWTPFTGIIEMTALVEKKEVGNRSLIYLPKYVDPGHELFMKTDQEIKKYFLDALFKMYPDYSDDDILHWNLATARRVFALPTLHYSDRLPPVTTSLKGFYIVNSAQITTGTLNVNETIQVAESKLNEILIESL